jgi:hypothetical protein
MPVVEDPRNASPLPRDGGSRPVPDPTELTDRAIARLRQEIIDIIEAQLAIRDERLRGIDEATKLRLAGMDGLASEIDTKVGRLGDVHEEKFKSIATQFTERDTRAERESRDNKLAVDAAFAAQEKLAIAQQASNAEAIDKSEKATAETIKTNQELNKATTDILTKSLDEVKLAVTRIESTKVGSTESRMALYAGIGVLALIIGTVIGVVAALATAAPI